jgi:hypothetical protein
LEVILSTRHFWAKMQRNRTGGSERSTPACTAGMLPHPNEPRSVTRPGGKVKFSGVLRKISGRKDSPQTLLRQMVMVADRFTPLSGSPHD